VKGKSEGEKWRKVERYEYLNIQVPASSNQPTVRSMWTCACRKAPVEKEKRREGEKERRREEEKEKRREGEKERSRLDLCTILKIHFEEKRAHERRVFMLRVFVSSCLRVFVSSCLRVYRVYRVFYRVYPVIPACKERTAR
jgi:hypothetical protein